MKYKITFFGIKYRIKFKSKWFHSWKYLKIDGLVLTFWTEKFAQKHIDKIKRL